MHPDTANKLNGIGLMFRFITPVFQIILTITSSIILMYLSGLRTDIKVLETHFTNHLSDHKVLEVIYEKRLTGLETFIMIKR